MFFNSFGALNPVSDRIRAERLGAYLERNIPQYPAAQCLIDYVLTSPSEVYDQYLQALVTHILYAIRPFAYQTPEEDQTQIVLDLHPYLKSPQIFHPTWPFLCFALFLTHQSDDATRALIDNDIVDVLDSLSQRTYEKSLSFMFLWLLTTMSRCVDLTDCALKLRLERWVEQHATRKDSRAGRTTPPQYRSTPWPIPRVHALSLGDSVVGSTSTSSPTSSLSSSSSMLTFPDEQMDDAVKLQESTLASFLSPHIRDPIRLLTVLASNPSKDYHRCRVARSF